MKLCGNCGSRQVQPDPFGTDDCVLCKKCYNKLCLDIHCDNTDFYPENWSIYYINLDHRTDRKLETENELTKVNLCATRISAYTNHDIHMFAELASIKHSQVEGEYGCTTSHYSILKDYLHSQQDKHLCVFEDDVHFCIDFHKRLNFIAHHFELSWDMFYLGGFMSRKHLIPTNYSHIYRVNKVWGTHAILINVKSIPKIITLIYDKITQFSAIDEIYSSFLNDLNAFFFTPGMVGQRVSKSNINIQHKLDTMYSNDYEYHIKQDGTHTFAEQIT